MRRWICSEITPMIPQAKRIAPDHPVRKLFTELSQWSEYPDGVVAVPEQILGTSFFPGGTGLWCEDSQEVPMLPVGGVMVLGHDFHNVAGYERSLQNLGENLRDPTWRSLRKLLSLVPILPEQCFFTNSYMGLREGNATTGRFPGSLCPGFILRCQRFLVQQIQVQRPRVILALGKWVPEFLAPLSTQLSAWDRLHSFKAIDSAGPLILGVSFTDVPNHECAVVSLLHPCLRSSNIRHRAWRSWKGEAAELKMLQYAMSLNA
jgi:uracil-DNA glycosylase